MNSDKDTIKLKAYAKINLALHITGLRQDGYHLLDSIFLPVGIYDEITINKADSGIKVRCDGGIPADERNTAYKAAKILMDSADINGADIDIKKNIPAMAGLGGGSSDAAAVLIGMNKLYNLGMDKEKLAKIGLEIGADVPFFLGEGAARVRGIGEIVTPVKANAPFHLVIIKPDACLSTAGVYKLYDEATGENEGDCSGLAEALIKNDLRGVAGLLHNDLQAAAGMLCPDIRASIEFLKTNGAMAAAMTGSGSCVFGIFGSQDMARAAEGGYTGNGKAYLTRPVGRPVIPIL